MKTAAHVGGATGAAAKPDPNRRSTLNRSPNEYENSGARVERAAYAIPQKSALPAGLHNLVGQD